MLKKVQSLFLTNKVAVLLILLGSLSWFLTIGKSGLKYDYGIGYWGANGYDGVWHLALINNFSKFDFTNPVLAGEPIKNYHIGYDVLLGLLKRLTGFDSSFLYFQIFPILTSLLIGLSIYYFVYVWTKNNKSALFSTFFIYFGGSMAWVLGLGESTFWSHQSVSTLINPPFAFSILLIILGLISLQRRKLLLSVIFFGSLVQIKAYAAALVIAGLFAMSFYSWFKDKNIHFFKVAIGSLLLNILLLNVVKNDNISVFTYYPFWFLETLFAASDRLPWPKMAEAMLSYKNQSVVVKYLLAYGLAGLLFILGNFWTRLIFIKDIFKKLDEYKVFMLTIVVLGLIMPTFFVQVGTPWNTIQFMYYSLFFSAILAGLTLSTIKNNAYIILVILTTLPTTLISLKSTYVTNTPPAAISNSEIEALNYLKKQSDGVVLTFPFDTAFSVSPAKNKIPLYKYSNTAYVPAYTSKNIFFERTNVELMGYKWEERPEMVLEFFRTTDLEKAKGFLKNNNIKYLYLVKEMSPLQGELFKVSPAEVGLKKEFENEVVVIYSY